MTDTPAVLPSVSNRLWELAKQDAVNAPLLRQAHDQIVTYKAFLDRVVINACALGFEGNELEGAFQFFEGLAEDFPTVNLARQKARELAIAKQKIADVAVLLRDF